MKILGKFTKNLRGQEKTIGIERIAEIEKIIVTRKIKKKDFRRSCE